MHGYAITLPDETLEAMAKRAAELVEEKLGRRILSPWMTRQEAAEYLRVPVSRLEKRRDIPQHKDAGRVLYNREELDAWLQTTT